jgi:signal transduction histidine kinase
MKHSGNNSYQLKTPPARQNPISKTDVILSMNPNGKKSVPFSFRSVSTSTATHESRLKKDDLSLFKSLIINRPSLSWIIAADDTLVFANPAFLRRFGLNESAFQKKIQFILPASIVEVMHEHHTTVCKNKLAFVTTKQLIRYNEQDHLYHINIYPVTGNNGEIFAAGEAWSIERKHVAPRISDIQALENRLAEEKKQHDNELARTIVQVLEKERSHLGHELHDNINQLLAVSKIFLESIQDQDEENKMLKDKAMDSLLLAMEEIRKLAKAKVAPQLKHNGLIESINCLVNDINSSGLFLLVFDNCNCNLEGLTQEKKIMLFRIVQEQINNIIKYSKAKNVTITLTHISNIVELSITDDGVGFDTRAVKNGVGLPGIFERVENYHGKVSLKSAPGRGCSLTVHIPFS